MKPEQYYLFSFDSSHQVIDEERVVSGLAAALLSEISKSCSLSLSAAQTVLKEEDIGYQAAYKTATRRQTEVRSSRIRL